MALKLITAPTAEPITLDEAKAHLRVEGTDDDAYITSLIAAARQSVESLTGRALMSQAWELALDEFPRSCAADYRSLGRYQAAIDIPMPPLVSIESIKYVDTAGVQQTLDDSARQVDDYNAPARVVPAYGTTWPAARCQPNAVLIRFACGYASAAAVPQEI
ncbi:head-tail connector protein, partial [Methylobacterium marchantiae]